MSEFYLIVHHYRVVRIVWPKRGQVCNIAFHHHHVFDLASDDHFRLPQVAACVFRARPKAQKPKKIQTTDRINQGYVQVDAREGETYSSSTLSRHT